MEDHRLGGLDEAQGGQVSDLCSRDLGVVGEVELLDGRRGLEVGVAHPAQVARSVAARELVLTEDLEELDVAELTGAGLSQPGVDGVEHAAEFEGTQRGFELCGLGHPTASPPRWAKRPSAPWRCAGASGTMTSSAPSASVPATRIPLTVR